MEIPSSLILITKVSSVFLFEIKQEIALFFLDRLQKVCGRIDMCQEMAQSLWSMQTRPNHG
jgi:hypothetical protein